MFCANKGKWVKQSISSSSPREPVVSFSDRLLQQRMADGECGVRWLLSFPLLRHLWGLAASPEPLSAASSPATSEHRSVQILDRWSRRGPPLWSEPTKQTPCPQIDPWSMCKCYTACWATTGWNLTGILMPGGVGTGLEIENCTIHSEAAVHECTKKVLISLITTRLMYSAFSVINVECASKSRLFMLFAEHGLFLMLKYLNILPLADIICCLIRFTAMAGVEGKGTGGPRLLLPIINLFLDPWWATRFAMCEEWFDR